MMHIERSAPARRLHPWRAALLLALAAILAAAGCGGGVGSGGTGAPVGVTAGTVNGFGSIVVDGTRFDDRSARVEAENAPGAATLAEARLGQRVAVDAASDGVARVIRVDALARGRVDALVAGGFVVLGQTVEVNTDSAQGPLTQFGDGLASLADLHVGDAVELHGVLRGSGATAHVQATRVDRLAAAPAHLKVAGVAATVSAVGGVTTLRLGGLTVTVGATAIEPAGAEVRDGRSVVVFAAAADLAGTPTAPSLAAERVQVRLRGEGDAAYFAGVIGGLDASAKTFLLDGAVVDYGRATLEPAGAVLADGRYVRLRGSFAADGRFIASGIALRDGTGSEAELKGTVSGFDAAAGRFTVRDTPVTLTSDTDLECAGGLADGRFVEVHGRFGTNGVVATELHCADEPADATVERDGRAGTPDLATSTFVLTTSRSQVTVRWTADTFFGDGLTPATLAGRAVEVEGHFDGAVLVAQTIKRDD